MARIRTSVVWWGLGAMVLSGCEPAAPPPPERTRPAGGVQQQASTELDQALAFLFRMNEFDIQQARDQVHLHLNSWVKKQLPDPVWQHDPLFDRLDANRFNTVPPPSALSRLQFESFDVVMLQEAVWLRDVTRWVASGIQHDPLLTDWLTQLSTAKGADHAEQVAEVCRLFDWVVRNIQLDAINGDQPGQPIPPAPITDEQLRNANGVLYPSEVLLLGHGDYIERSRLLIHLIRQLSIPAVMLGVTPPGEDYERPWAVAVLVGDDLYLFDLRLGLPIPTADGKGVATLAEVIKSPELAVKLYQDDSEKMGITAEELKQLIALIDASPLYLSQRMKMLESQLSGDRKVILTLAATPLRRRIETLPGVAQVRMWIQPYECFRYNQEMIDHPAVMQEVAQENFQFENRTPLGQARILHLRGAFDRTEDERGAKYYYMGARNFEEKMLRKQLVAQAEQEKRRANPNVEPQLTAEELERVELTIAMARQLTDATRATATYWLGLLCYDHGQYRVASNWCERVLNNEPNSRWEAGTQYQLARTLESLALSGDPSDQGAAVSSAGEGDVNAEVTEATASGSRDQWLRRSIELLEADPKNPQAVGNRLRAQRLRQLL